MDYAPSSRNSASTKIVVAGGFGVGKTTFVGAVSEIDPLRTEALVTQESEGQDDISQVQPKTHHHGGHGLRPHHARREPRALPVRHPRPAPVLVHVGRPGQGRHRRRRPGRHPPTRRQLRRRRLLRGQGAAVHRRASTSSTTPASSAPTRSARPSPISAHIPVITVDARDRESAKHALVRITEFALTQLTRVPATT